MHHLAQIYPQSLPYKKLLTESQSRVLTLPQRRPGCLSSAGHGVSPARKTSQQELPTRLLNAHLSNLIELTLSPPPLHHHPLSPPTLLSASPHARLPRRRQRKNHLTSASKRVQLSEPLPPPPRPPPNGLHDKPAHITLITHFTESGPLEPLPNPELTPTERATQYITEALPLFAKSALLIS